MQRFYSILLSYSIYYGFSSSEAAQEEWVSSWSFFSLETPVKTTACRWNISTDLLRTKTTAEPHAAHPENVKSHIYTHFPSLPALSISLSLSYGKRGRVLCAMIGHRLKSSRHVFIVAIDSSSSESSSDFLPKYIFWTAGSSEHIRNLGDVRPADFLAVLRLELFPMR